MINLGIVQEADLIKHQEKYNSIKIVGYADNSYAKDYEDKKSITRYFFCFDKEIVT